jgi:hypothetical protein
MRAQSGCCDIQKHPFRPQHSCLSLYSPSTFLHLFLRLPSSPSIWTLPAPIGRVESQRHDSAPNPHSAFPILIPIPIPSLVSWSQSSLPPPSFQKREIKKSWSIILFSLLAFFNHRQIPPQIAAHRKCQLLKPRQEQSRQAKRHGSRSYIPTPRVEQQISTSRPRTVAIQPPPPREKLSRSRYSRYFA